MSNSYRREAPQPQPQPVPRPTEPELVELVSAAIQTLYLARGGDDLDQQIKVARANIDNALVCREAERARLDKDANAMREKGERPIVSVSEDRLHSRELTRLHALRDELRLMCRNSIQDALRRNKPRSLEEVRKVLETATKDIDGVGNMLRALALEDEQQSETARLQEAAKQMTQVLTQAGESFMAVHAGKLTPQSRQQLTEALQSRDMDMLYAAFGQLPAELRDTYEQLINDLLPKA